jgi:hypothetical protein
LHARLLAKAWCNIHARARTNEGEPVDLGAREVRRIIAALELMAAEIDG